MLIQEHCHRRRLPSHLLASWGATTIVYFVNVSLLVCDINNVDCDVKDVNYDV